jgi:hypothetical protein
MLVRPKLGLILDSASFARSLGHKAPAEKVLLYRGSAWFDYIRSPFRIDVELLRQVPEYRYESDADGVPHGIQTDEATRHTFYGTAIVRGVAKELFKRENISAREMEIVLLPFVQLTLSRPPQNRFHLLVTGEEVLLKNRIFLRELGARLNIASIEEGLEIIRLYAKKNGVYYIRPPMKANEGYWYWLRLKSELKNYNDSTTTLYALVTRFVYLLMSLDEIGIQFYSGVDNDTLDRTSYYFNYFLTLASGMFDCLALETRDRLKISFPDNHTPWKTSLSNRAGEDFLRALRDKNPDLREHISHYMNFMNMVNTMRDLVVHREGLSKAGFESHRPGQRWEVNTLEIPEKVAAEIKSCGDIPKVYDAVSLWGVFRFGSEKHLLVPYYFAKVAARKLVEFTNQYLAFVGLSDASTESGSKDLQTDDLKLFESAN